MNILTCRIRRTHLLQTPETCEGLRRLSEGLAKVSRIELCGPVSKAKAGCRPARGLSVAPSPHRRVRAHTLVGDVGGALDGAVGELDGAVGQEDAAVRELHRPLRQPAGPTGQRAPICPGVGTTRTEGVGPG